MLLSWTMRRFTNHKKHRKLLKKQEPNFSIFLPTLSTSILSNTTLLLLRKGLGNSIIQNLSTRSLNPISNYIIGYKEPGAQQASRPGLLCDRCTVASTFFRVGNDGQFSAISGINLSTVCGLKCEGKARAAKAALSLQSPRSETNDTRSGCPLTLTVHVRSLRSLLSSGPIRNLLRFLVVEW